MPPGGAYGQGLHGAGLLAAVPGIAATVPDRYLRPRQPLELSEQRRLVGLHRYQQVPAKGSDVTGVGDLSV
jgi:hypothetical protein